MKKIELCVTLVSLHLGTPMSQIQVLHDTAETVRRKFSQGHQSDEELEARMNEERLGEWDDAAWRREDKGITA